MLNRVIALILICAFSFLVAKNSLANQTSFSRTNEDGNLQFAYAWKAKNNIYNLSFVLSRDTLMQVPETPIRFSNRMMQQEIYMALMAVSRDAQAQGIQVNIRRLNEGFDFNVQGPSDEQVNQVMQNLKAASQGAQSEFLEKNGFTLHQNAVGEQGIIYDHSHFARQSAPALTAVVEAIKSIQKQPKDIREFINIALSWIQSIPYDDLENRITSNGAGFLSPIELLKMNRGDCDSKSTLLAALLMGYNENLDITMVLLPQHALIGIPLPATPDQITIQQNQTTYLLLEPTGPAYHEIGEVADSTLMAILNRQYSLNSM
ncbi:hypothetical protein [Glaciecola sp. 1036]|uniref:hypothetical protein n=1 Tax=Alteromonadaceae TaxID=72275 RepID=UPI003D087ABE